MQATNATAIGVTGSDALQVSKKGDSNEWEDTGPKGRHLQPEKH